MTIEMPLRPVATAQSEVIVSCSAVVPRAPLAIPRFDLKNLRRGVRYRLLYPDRARTMPALARRLGELLAAGAEVRTLTSVPIDALVVDRSLAVLPRDAGVQGPGELALFQLPSVVATTVELFHRLWASAAPLGATLPPERGLTERDMKLLELLSAGCTDLTVARRLGVSVRTVRRMMADVMNRLGARSRFQAGAKAADRGWLKAV